MQEPVGEQKTHLNGQGAPSAVCLTLGRVQGNDDITEHAQITARPKHERRLEFILRKRQHICGLVFAAVYIGLNLVADVISILANPRLRHPK